VDGIEKAPRSSVPEDLTDCLEILCQLHARAFWQEEIGNEQVDLGSALEDLGGTFRISGG